MKKLLLLMSFVVVNGALSMETRMSLWTNEDRLAQQTMHLLFSDDEDEATPVKSPPLLWVRRGSNAVLPGNGAFERRRPTSLVVQRASEVSSQVVPAMAGYDQQAKRREKRNRQRERRRLLLEEQKRKKQALSDKMIGCWERITTRLMVTHKDKIIAEIRKDQRTKALSATNTARWERLTSDMLVAHKEQERVRLEGEKRKKLNFKRWEWLTSTILAAQKQKGWDEAKERSGILLDHDNTVAWVEKMVTSWIESTPDRIKKRKKHQRAKANQKARAQAESPEAPASPESPSRQKIRDLRQKLEAKRMRKVRAEGSESSKEKLDPMIIAVGADGILMAMDKEEFYTVGSDGSNIKLFNETRSWVLEAIDNKLVVQENGAIEQVRFTSDAVGLLVNTAGFNPAWSLLAGTQVLPKSFEKSVQEIALAYDKKEFVPTPVDAESSLYCHDREELYIPTGEHVDRATSFKFTTDCKGVVLICSSTGVVLSESENGFFEYLGEKYQLCAVATGCTPEPGCDLEQGLVLQKKANQKLYLIETPIALLRYLVRFEEKFTTKLVNRYIGTLKLWEKFENES